MKKLVQYEKITRVTINSICYLFIFLFVYAALSKLIDYETFTIQMAQSPLLTAFAGYLGWIVPFVEIVVALLLFFTTSRVVGLYASFLIMVLFTGYIFLILNFSDFVPCSCGGVLEKMTWHQHLVFNVFFILLAGVAMFLLHPVSVKNNILILSLLCIFGLGLLIILFALSESVVHRNNSFIRRYPHTVAIFNKAIDLEHNSWYLAGADIDRIYLANATAPLNMRVLDTSLQKIGDYLMTIDNMDLPFTSVRVDVQSPFFYVTDGAVPVIFRGKVRDWRASRLLNDSIFFSISTPMDSMHIAVRFISGKSGENEIGILRLSDSTQFIHNDRLLEKQIDGVFDTDGQLLYNSILNKLLYVYFYRNEYLVINPDLTLDHKGKTIDTTSRANLNVSHASDESIRLASPSFPVNSFSTANGANLYIQSDRLGRYEPKEMLKEASIIDVYNISQNTYQYSFYIHNYEKTKMNSFLVSGDKLIAIMGRYLVVYDLLGE